MLTSRNENKWVFLDIGNVIFYDLPLLARIWKYFYLTLKEGGLNMSFEEIIRERELLLKDNPPETNPRKMIADRHALHIERQVVDKAVNEWRSVYLGSNYPVRGIKDVLIQLQERYNLGIIANQPPTAVDELRKYDLDKFFNHMTISDVVGYHKPDPRIFKHALTATGADLEKSIMVGDRIDNDVRPAKTLGMKAIWLDMDYRDMDYRPEDDYERLYIQSYLKVTGIDQSYKGTMQEPDLVIHKLEELPKSIELAWKQQEAVR